jgi:hypothetical protein
MPTSMRVLYDVVMRHLSETSWEISDPQSPVNNLVEN